VLGELAAASLPDEAWLRAIAAWADAQMAERGEGATVDTRAHIIGLVLFADGQ
jgi:hypothetical protein